MSAPIRRQNLTVVVDSPDRDREEEPWTDRNERIVNCWSHEVMESIDDHHKAGYWYQRRKHLVTIPALLVPLLAAPFAATFKEESWVVYVNMLAYMTTSLFAGISAYCNLPELETKHFCFKALYTELLHDIQMEMGKQRKYRPQADIYQLKIRLKLDHLGREAPEFPRSVAEVRGE